MRIGLDMLAVQSPHHGARGIGRYSANLVRSLLARADGHEYVLYTHEGLDDGRLPASPAAEVRVLRPRWDRGESIAACLDRLARTNPDGLDALVILSPFEHWGGYSVPSKPDDGPKLVSVVYDLIPFLFQNDHAVDPILSRHHTVLERLKSYDALLAISEATRQDVLSILRVSDDRVVNVSAASDPAYFVPDRLPEPSDRSRRVLNRYGIERPFVFNVGGLDERKNPFRLIEAFAGLPATLRDRLQLVFTSHLTHSWAYRLHEYAREQGVGGSLVLTGEVDDEALRVFYQRCEAFVFPSAYEGFGLPILEAMHCGAPVIAGNNSSQVEVVGGAGLLAEAMDANDISDRLAAVLGDPELARGLREKSVAQAATFSWERTGSLALETISAAVSRPRRPGRFRADVGHRVKPAVAFFSPFPPRKSGVSDYSALLVEELRKTYTIDLYHDRNYVPAPAVASDEYMSCDARVFDRLAAAKDYHAVVYQMGNSHYHEFLFPVMRKHPGVVTLHDFCLAGFHANYGRAEGRGLGFIREELLRCYPGSREQVLRVLAESGHDREELARECARRGWWLNRVVLESAQVMIVHSPWCERQVRAGSPEYADKVVVVPHGIHPRRLDASERAAIRDRFQIPRDALVVASFGFVHPDKMSPQALEAFVPVARENPNAVFVFVGEEADGGCVQRHAAGLGITNRVRFLGRQPAEAFAALMNVTDLGVNLRMPPTNGETSGALLNLLASGVATVVTDVATFSDYPADSARKVRWETDGQDGLSRAIYGLATDHAARDALGRAARDHIERYYTWSRVAGLYVDAIERCHDELSAGRRAAGEGGRALTRAAWPMGR